MQQVSDFLEESDVLAAALEGLPPGGFERQTLFKKWSINDILVHLHFWNLMADYALHDAAKFDKLIGDLQVAITEGSLRKHENSIIHLRGNELFEEWQGFYRDMAERWASVDPKTRVKWAGPDMSARSAISARQMETWAHGQAVFDLIGQERPESDRIKNIVFLGVNAFGWSHKVHGLAVPKAMPKLNLEAPSGTLWEFGDENAGRITGSATEFCQVVTQTRNILDTSLILEGVVAETWMKHAQCFAGPPETPPPPGTRKISI